MAQFYNVTMASAGAGKPASGQIVQQRADVCGSAATASNKLFTMTVLDTQ
jgi:hypothetical protein